jgi:carbonic anhydrase/acetyltransferase-like protein (isoleucine patch superfamily)
MNDEAETVMASLREAYFARERDLAEKWQRSLPFQDAMFDRWERAHRLGFGEGASIYNSACIFGQVAVGQGTWIGPYVILDASASELSIGAWCSISAGVHIYTHDSVAWALSGGRRKARIAPVRIGDCTYIGSQSVIPAGVTVGRHVVIGANSFVNRDVPDRTVVAGSPARVIGHVEGEGEDVRVVFARDERRD